MQDAEIVYPNLGLEDDTEEVYTDAVEEPRDTPGGVISGNDTCDALSDTFGSLRNNIGKADDDDIVTKSKHGLFNLPTCGTIIFSAVGVKEGSLLTRALQECKSSLTLLAWLSILMTVSCRSFSTGRGRKLSEWGRGINC